jgi:recombination protein RecR
MDILPLNIQKLIERFSRLPSIGPRQATRLVFYLINQGPNEILGLANQIQELQKIKICSFCFFPHQNQNGLCNICSNPERDTKTIMIVEKETDLISLEKAAKFRGRYFIIEIILAFNPDSLGNLAASLIEKEMKDFTLKITRLGRGLPTGGEIEFADDETLKSSIENRQ